jgi:hypothetical protein
MEERPWWSRRRNKSGKTEIKPNTWANVPLLAGKLGKREKKSILSSINH